MGSPRTAWSCWPGCLHCTIFVNLCCAIQMQDAQKFWPRIDMRVLRYSVRATCVRAQ